MENQTYEQKTDLALQEKALPAEYLERIGVTAGELPEIAELSGKLNVEDGLSVTGWGREAAEHTVAYADRMLEMVNTRDLDEAGKSLNTVLTKAKTINTSGLAINRSRIPVIGPVIDKFRVRYSSAMAQFSTAREAIDSTTEEIKETQSNLEQRIKDLDEAFNQVQDEYHMLGKYIAAGKLASTRGEVTSSSNCRTKSGPGVPLLSPSMALPAASVTVEVPLTTNW